MISVTRVMIGVWLALLPILVISYGYVQGITVNKSYEQEYNSCQQSIADAKATQKQLEENRDVYCVKEFGKPNVFLPVSLFVIGGTMYIFGLFSTVRERARLDLIEAKIEERERLQQKRKGVYEK